MATFSDSIGMMSAAEGASKAQGLSFAGDLLHLDLLKAEEHKTL